MGIKFLPHELSQLIFTKDVWAKVDGSAKQLSIVFPVHPFYCWFYNIEPINSYMESIQELIQVVNNQPKYTFTTDEITFSTTELKGEKQAYVTGYISVPEVDIYNDLVTPAGMQSMLRQIEESTITIDYEHEAWRDDNSILPVAKIIEAKVDDRGLWIKCKLNKNSPKYEDLWGSIKEGFITAFSIGYQALRTVEKEIDGVMVRLIEELRLLNVAFTGAPVNRGAVVTGVGMKSVMLKSILDLEKDGEQIIVPKRLLNKILEEKSMTEEDVKTETTESTEDSVVEEKSGEETPTEEKTTEVVETNVEEKTEGEESATEEAEATEENKTEKVVAELKSMVEKQNETIEKQAAELKSLQDNEVFKSPTPTKPEVKSIENIDALSLIR